MSAGTRPPAPQRPFESPPPGSSAGDPVAGEPATLRESRRAGTVALVLLALMIVAVLLAALI
jgi:hypothetical protein